MQHVRHALPIALIAAALAAGTAACGSVVPGSAYATGSATPTVTPDPLARLTGDQITREAIANLSNASSVRLAETILVDSYSNMSVNLTLVHDRGCEGSANIYGMGGLQFVYDEKSIWVRFSDAFYKSHGVSAAEIPLLSGKWLKESKKSDPSLPSACSLSSLAGVLGEQDTGMTKGAVTSFDGQRVVMITQARESSAGAIYVSDTARPELLRLNSMVGLNVLGGAASSGSAVGYITFSGYGLPAAITPPPASKTLNGGELVPKIGPITV